MLAITIGSPAAPALRMTAGAKSAVAAVVFKNALRVVVMISSPCRDANLLSKNHAIVGGLIALPGSR